MKMNIFFKLMFARVFTSAPENGVNFDIGHETNLKFKNLNSSWLKE